jgi:putative ABC transport system substrate-binding protein
VAQKPDVLVAVTRPAALAAQRATTTVPIVFILVPDPVGSKLVQSLPRPGGNITGLSVVQSEFTGKSDGDIEGDGTARDKVRRALDPHRPLGASYPASR